MTQREDFLKALAANEDNTTVRLAFADWLDARGEHEEADRQRKWPMAKQWLVEFANKNNPPLDYPREPDEPIDLERFVPYELLLKRGLEAARDCYAEFRCGSNEGMRYALEAENKKFWECWSIVMGRPLPPGFVEKVGYTCGC